MSSLPRSEDSFSLSATLFVTEVPRLCLVCVCLEEARGDAEGEADDDARANMPDSENMLLDYAGFVFHTMQLLRTTRYLFLSLIERCGFRKGLTSLGSFSRRDSPLRCTCKS